MGPLEVTDVKANGCKLKWKKPEDDGGMPIDHYEASGCACSRRRTYVIQISVHKAADKVLIRTQLRP